VLVVEAVGAAQRQALAAQVVGVLAVSLVLAAQVYPGR